MHRLLIGAAEIAGLVVTSACVPHIYDNFNVDAYQVATLDAQQRVILVTRYGRPNHDKMVVCAEPSPDAMSAIAAAAAARGGNGQVEAGLGYALSQTAASIGIRTPTIQLLRDGLYRACEGYLNGLLTPNAYEIILRNYDRVMVSLLAIDAATGSPHPPPVTISGGNVQVSDAPISSSPGTGVPSGSALTGGGANSGTQNPKPTAGGGASTDININTPGNTVAKVDSTTGIPNADQVINRSLRQSLIICLITRNGSLRSALPPWKILQSRKLSRGLVQAL